MPTTAANVEVVQTGRLYYAPLGTAIPTAHDSALDAAFIDLGGISDEGFQDEADVSEQEYTDADGVTYLKSVESASLNLTVTFVESTAAVRNFWHGVATTPASGRYDFDPTNVGDDVMLVHDAVMKSGVIRRRFYPSVARGARSQEPAQGGVPELWGIEMLASVGTVDAGPPVVTSYRAEWRG